MNETAERLYREARARLGLDQTPPSGTVQESAQETSLPLSPRSQTSDTADPQIEEIEVQNSPD